MKRLFASAFIAGFALVGCATVTDQDGRIITADAQTHPRVIKVINIPSIKIEVHPEKAMCELPLTNGTVVVTECLQYRQPFQKNFNILAGGIEGFDFEPGYRYLLDIRQQAVPDETTGDVKPVWILNNVVSKIKD